MSDLVFFCFLPSSPSFSVLGIRTRLAPAHPPFLMGSSGDQRGASASSFLCLVRVIYIHAPWGREISQVAWSSLSHVKHKGIWLYYVYIYIHILKEGNCSDCFRKLCVETIDFFFLVEAKHLKCLIILFNCIDFFPLMCSNLHFYLYYSCIQPLILREIAWLYLSPLAKNINK